MLFRSYPCAGSGADEDEADALLYAPAVREAAHLFSEGYSGRMQKGKGGSLRMLYRGGQPVRVPFGG